MGLIKMITIFVILSNLVYIKHAFTKNHQNIKVKITSFWRSPQEQAHLLYKLKSRGVNLKTLYKETEIVEGIQKAVSVEEAELVIRKYINLGRYLSKHMCGKALDIGKKEDGVKDFIAFVSNSKDIEIIDEKDHFHLQMTTKCGE